MILLFLVNPSSGVSSPVSSWCHSNSWANTTYMTCWVNHTWSQALSCPTSAMLCFYIAYMILHGPFSLIPLFPLLTWLDHANIPLTSLPVWLGLWGCLKSASFTCQQPDTELIICVLHTYSRPTVKSWLYLLYTLCTLCVSVSNDRWMNTYCTIAILGSQFQKLLYAWLKLINKYHTLSKLSKSLIHPKHTNYDFINNQNLKCCRFYNSFIFKTLLLL